MFGGVGLYSGDVFFGIVAADVLYFKVGDANRAEYEQSNAAPFAPYAGRPSIGFPPFQYPCWRIRARSFQWAARSIEVARLRQGSGRQARARKRHEALRSFSRRASTGLQFALEGPQELRRT